MSIDRVADCRRRFCTFKRLERERVTEEGKEHQRRERTREGKETKSKINEREREKKPVLRNTRFLHLYII